MEPNIPVTPVRQTSQQTSQQPGADSNSTPVRSAALKKKSRNLEDKLAILTGQKDGLRELMVEYLKIPVPAGCLNFHESQAFQTLINPRVKGEREKDLYAPLQTFFNAVTPLGARNKFWKHQESSDTGANNDSIPDFGLYQAGREVIVDAKAKLKYSELLVCLEVKTESEDAIRSVRSGSKHHEGFRDGNGDQLTRFVEGLKSARQAPFHIIIYIYGATSFRLLVSLPDHLFATEKLGISECKVEFLSLLSHLSNMNDDDFGLLQKLQAVGTNKIDYNMELRPGLTGIGATQESNVSIPSGQNANIRFERYTGKINTYRRAGVVGSIPWFFEGRSLQPQAPQSPQFFKSRWVHTSKKTEDMAYDAIMGIPDEQASECGGFTKPDIDRTRTGVYKDNFATNAELARVWLVEYKLILSKTRWEEYMDAKENQEQETYLEQYFYNRHLVVITFNKTYETVTEINNLYEWLVIFTKCATSLGFIVDKLGIFHGDISPKNIVFERGSDGVLGDVVIIDWECVKNIVPDSTDARLQNERTGTALFMSPFVEYRVGQKALDDFNALFFVHCYMLHFFNVNVKLDCQELFSNQKSKLKYASGRLPDGILEEPLDLGANDTLQFMLFNSILREIPMAQFSSLQHTPNREIGERLITAFNNRTDKRSEKLIHAFTIACEWFLGGLLGQALPKTDALDARLERIRIEFKDLYTLLQRFHDAVLAMPQQTCEAFKQVKFEGSTTTDALNYLYPKPEDTLGEKSYLDSLRKESRKKSRQSKSSAPWTNNSRGQQKRSADSYEGNVGQSSKRSRQD